MSLEISEIGVHVAVGESAAAAKVPAAQGGGMTTAQQEDIVAACVKEVLRQLRMQDER